MPMPSKAENNRLCFQQIQGYAYFTSSKIARYHTFLDMNIPLRDFRETIFLDTIDYLYRHNPTLRAVIRSEEGCPCQAIDEQKEAGYYIDYHFPAEDSDPESCHATAKSQACEKIDLNGGCLSRVAILVYPDRQAECMLFLHHIIADQMSMTILHRQFLTVYSLLQQSNFSPENLPQPAYSGSILDYAGWQYANWTKKKEKFIRYWHTTLGAYNEKLIPNLLRLSPTYWSHAEEHALNDILNDAPSGFHIQLLRGKCKDSLYRLASRLHQSIATVFTGLYGLLPYYQTGKGKSLSALVVRDTGYPKVRDMVGPFTGAIYVTKEPDVENDTYEDYFQATFFHILQAAQYLITDHVSLHLHGRLLRLNCDVFLNVFPAFLDVSLDKTYYTGEAYAQSHIYYALECNVYEQKDHIYILWGYNKALYSADRIHQLSCLLEKLLLHIDTHYPFKIQKQL